jgi:hypothetical protein
MHSKTKRGKDIHLMCDQSSRQLSDFLSLSRLGPKGVLLVPPVLHLQGNIFQAFLQSCPEIPMHFQICPCICQRN